MPKLSVITITFNSERYLEDTIVSVVGQKGADIEYIVVDGGSTDGTLDIVRKYEDQIDTWLSEPDKGIADAMNKGVQLATGDFIYFLHSDDYLLDESVLAKALSQLTPGNDIFLFSICLDDDGTKTLHRPRGFNAWLRFKTGVYHQGAICSMRLFESIGGFDTDLHIAMDYEFFLRAYRQGFKAVEIDMPLATMRLVGVSSQRDWTSLERRFGEERRVHSAHADSLWLRAVYRFYWALYMPYRRLRYRLS